MELRKMAMSLAVALISMLWTGAMAQSDCTNVLLSMSPCLNYITGNSSSPSSQCCSQLASVVRSSPRCLCQVLSGGGSSLGLNINQTQALTLPGACNVETPPISSCNNAAASPAESPFGTPSTPTTPSGTESKTVPSTRVDGTSDGSSSDGSSIKLSISLLASLLLAVSYSSVFATLIF